jgi:hypothetical protein
MSTAEDDFQRKINIEYQLDGIIDLLRQLLLLQKANYEPYKEKQTKLAIRALLNIRGLKK